MNALEIYAPHIQDTKISQEWMDTANFGKKELSCNYPQNLGKSVSFG